MSDATTSYLQDDLRKTLRRYRIISIATPVAAVVLIAYFQWVTSLTRDLLKPANIAELLANEAGAKLPEASAALQQTLTGAAPEVIRFGMQQLMDTGLPALHAGVESQMREYSEQITNAGADGVVTAFDAMLRESKGKLSKRDAKDTAKTATVVTTLVRTRFAKHLDAAAEEPVRARVRASAEALRTLDAKLKGLAANKRPDREEQFGRRLITNWWSFLGHNSALTSADLQVEPVKAARKRAPSK